jgi:hypothetical protein
MHLREIRSQLLSKYTEVWLMRILLVVLLLFCGTASAQRVFKCTDEKGKVTFQQASCKGKPIDANAVRLDAAPTLTEEEKFRGAAFRAGMTPEEARARLRETDANQQHAGRQGQIPAAADSAQSTAQQPPLEPEETALRCTSAGGRVYYRPVSEGCGSSTVFGNPEVRNWQQDRVADAPGAVMVAPNQAIDPHTGKILELQDTPAISRPSMQLRDHAEGIDKEKACQLARADALRQRDKNMHLTFDQRRKIDDRVNEICKPVQAR